jgi:hypothetical protein
MSTTQQAPQEPPTDTTTTLPGRHQRNGLTLPFSSSAEGEKAGYAARSLMLLTRRDQRHAEGPLR